MISRLRGELIEANLGRIVVECAGVGYEVMIPPSSIGRMPLEGERVDLFVRQIVREDALLLVGFLDLAERALFDLLTEVKGCGPRIALQAIGDLGAERAVAAIATGDTRTLTQVSGVGPRLAERILVELRDKIQQSGLAFAPSIPRASAVTPSADRELVDALLALGYKRAEAESTASQVPADAALEERLRQALRSLSR